MDSFQTAHLEEENMGHIWGTRFKDPSHLSYLHAEPFLLPLYRTFGAHKNVCIPN